MEKRHPGFKYLDGLDHPLSLKNLELHAVDGALCADPPYKGKKHGKSMEKDIQVLNSWMAWMVWMVWIIH